MKKENDNRFDKDCFDQVMDARRRMFGSAMPDFGDSATFEKLAEERAKLFSSTGFADERSFFGMMGKGVFGFGSSPWDRSTHEGDDTAGKPDGTPDGEDDPARG